MDWAVVWKYLPVMLEGFWVTLLLWPIGVALALALGALLLAAGRSGVAPLVLAARTYTEVILGIPILVLAYVIYFVLPKFGILLSEVTAGLITIMLHYSPYMAEVMRGAVNAIPAGQIEAARTVGMSRAQIARRVVLPLALGLVLPPLTGICIGLMKDTAVFSFISVHEFFYQTKQTVSRTYAPFETWIMVAVIYYVVLSAFEQVMRLIERRVTAYRGSTERVAVQVPR